MSTTNTTIRLSNRTLAKAGFKGYEACEVIEERLDTEGAVKARCYADSYTFTIEVDTDYLVDAVTFLKEIKLIS